VGKPERRRPLGRPRHKWVDNIKVALRQMGWSDIDRVDLAHNRDQWRRAVMNRVMNLWVP
jgi:hypothetical protein